MTRDFTAGIIAGVLIALLWRGWKQLQRDASTLELLSPFRRAS